MTPRRETDLMVIAALTMLITPWLSRTPGWAGRDGGPATPAPADTGKRSVWGIIKGVVVQFSADRVMAEAAGVTFYALLALFPALAALVSLYGLVADPQTVAKDLNGLTGLIPGGGLQLLNEELKQLTSSNTRALGFGAIVGLLTSVWSANAGMKAMFDALNAVNDEKEQRNFFTLTAFSLTFTLGSLIFMILAMSGVVVLPAVLAFVGFGGTTELVLRLVRWPMLLAALSLFLAFLYRFGPSRPRGRFKWFSWGSMFSAVVWVAASGGFSWYVASFGSYNKTYGSLGAVIGFMTWIWISAIIILTGAELNAQIEAPLADSATRHPVFDKADRLLRA